MESEREVLENERDSLAKQLKQKITSIEILTNENTAYQQQLTQLASKHSTEIQKLKEELSSARKLAQESLNEKESDLQYQL